MERDWILSILEEGIRDRYCYELCEQQGIFQSLLGFCSSPLCDDGTQAQIIRVLSRAARVTQAAYNLTKACGLLSWILQLLDQRRLDQQLLGAVIELVHALWVTNLGQKEKLLDGLKTLAAEEKPVKPVKCLPLPLTCEFICVASTITKLLRLCVKTSHFSLFLHTYSSVLNHYRASLDMSTQGGRLSLLPEPLSCSDALALLHCWARLNQDAQLLSEVQRVSEKHHIKHLLSIGKNKPHPKGFSSTARVKKTNPSPESGSDEPEDLPLSECLMSLCSVLSHWTPVFSFSQGQTSEPPDREEPGDMSKDTALLLIKWSLRTLLETPHPKHKTADFLHWLQTAVVQYKVIVDALVLDTCFKADLMRLYHQVFECSPAMEMAELRLFTDIMMRLLESQGQLPETHRAVVSSCLPEDGNQQNRLEAGLFLSSLYIHEVWSGLRSAELFMSHVRLVTKHTTKKKKAPALSECPVRAVCNHIITSTTE